MAKDKSENQEEMLKRVALYQEHISAWTSNRMEIGKRILTLSGLAVGFLLTFRSEIEDFCSFVILFFAFVLFLASMGLFLRIFRQNSDYIMLIANSDDEKKKEKIKKSLSRNMRFAVCSFVGGMVLTFVLAMYIALYN